jgi:hypothetical protein
MDLRLDESEYPKLITSEKSIIPPYPAW